MKPLEAVHRELLLTTAALLMTQVPEGKEPKCKYDDCGKVATDFAWCGMTTLTVRPVCRAHVPLKSDAVSTLEVRRWVRLAHKPIEAIEPTGDVQIDRTELGHLLLAAFKSEFDIHVIDGRFLPTCPENEKAIEWLKKHRSHA